MNVAYRFRLYAPTSGVRWISIYYGDANGGNLQFVDSVEPAGDTAPCFDDRECEAELIYLLPTLDSGAKVDHWLVNRDNNDDTREEIYTEAAGVTPGSVTNLYVKLVMVEQTKYYASLYFDANGGKYPPDPILDQYTTNANQYVKFYLPDEGENPIREGYIFEGWSLDEDGSGDVWYPGGTITLWGSEYGEEYTLFAVWKSGSGGIYIDTGSGPKHGTAYIWDDNQGKWVKGSVYVHDGKWKEGV